MPGNAGYLLASKSQPVVVMATMELTGAVVAYMAAGWEGSEGHAPGFPDDGSWVVKHEGLLKAL